MAETSEARQVFLSYAREDAAFMRRVRDDLRAEGLTVWTDETGLEPGTPDWEDSIDEALEGAGCIVVLLSPDAKESRWVGIEVARSDESGKRIIPVLLRGEPLDAVPLRLTNYQWIDARTDYRSAIEKLVEAICEHLKVEPLSAQRDRAAREDARRRREEAERLQPVGRPSTQKAAQVAKRPAAPPAQPKASRSPLRSPFLWIGCAVVALIVCIVVALAAGGPIIRWVNTIISPVETPWVVEDERTPEIFEPGMDRNLPPNSGEVELSPGFMPDPVIVPMVVGGDLPAYDAVPGCVGHVMPASDVHFYYLADGGFLRIFFLPDDRESDTTLIISDPNNDWLCNDDAFGLNPAIDLEPAQGGWYAIWVGSYAPGEQIPGALFITERNMTPADVP